MRARSKAVAVLALAATLTSSPGVTLDSPRPRLLDEAREDLLKAFFLESVKRVLGPGGEIVAATSDWVIDPLVTASTTPGDTGDRVAAWVAALGQAGLNVVYPPYGVALVGGKILLGGAVFTVESMIAAAEDQQTQAILLGKGEGGFLDRINNPLAETPFVELPFVVNLGITPENLGTAIRRESELRDLWFGRYGSFLRDLYGRRNAEAALDQAWPALLRMWQAQRARVAVKRLARELDDALREARRRTGETLHPKPAGTPSAPAAKAVPGPAATPRTDFGPEGEFFCCQWRHKDASQDTCGPMNQPPRCLSLGGRVMRGHYCHAFTFRCTPVGQ